MFKDGPVRISVGKQTILMILVVFLSPSKQIHGEYLKLSHDHFLLCPFQFFIIQSFYTICFYSRYISYKQRSQKTALPTLPHKMDLCQLIQCVNGYGCLHIETVASYLCRSMSMDLCSCSFCCAELHRQREAFRWVDRLSDEPVTWPNTSVL